MRFIPEKFKEISQEISEHGHLLKPKDVIELLKKEPGLAFVNKGRECIVVADTSGSDSDAVIAINYSTVSPTEQKIIFFNQRIFSALFPHNFPKFFSGFGSTANQQKPAGTLRKKINGPFSYQYGGNIKYPISEVQKQCKNLGIYLDLDSKKENFIVGDDQGEYYVDTLHLNEAEISDPKKLLAYMELSGQYDPSAILLVKMSIMRLKELKKEF